jgi:hypothetical protein
MSKEFEGVLRRILESACEEHKASLSDLTVLSTPVDPYRIDTAAGHRDGQWLAEQLAKAYGPAQRAHWRGLHYAIVQDGTIRKPDGEIYQNTDDDWEWLIGTPAKAARWLGYVGFDRIVDQRNAPPIIHRKPRARAESYLAIGIDIDIPDAEDIDPEPVARGFVARQPYHFVIFGEKSSLEDVVKPIAEQYEADLYLPTGEISDTLVYQIAKEANDDGRPLVLFTLSDCDPAGHQMPVSIARKLQAFADLFFPRLRFEVVRVGLMPEQVKEEGLPSTPLKKGEKRASRWREAFGIDQTEIDALTTPSERRVLQRLIRQSRTSIRRWISGSPTPSRSGTPLRSRRSRSRSMPRILPGFVNKRRPSSPSCASRSIKSTTNSIWPPATSRCRTSRCRRPRLSSILIGKP